MAKRDNHAAARALADAVLTSDRKAAEKHGITDRTLRNYRAALDDDPELSALFRATVNEALTRSWAEELDAGLRDLINQLRTRADHLVHGVTGYVAITDAVRALGEIAVAREVLRAASDPDAAPATTGAPPQATHPVLN